MCDDDERKGESETRSRLIVCSSRKSTCGQSGITSPSDGRIAINSRPVMYNLAISPEVENFQMKIYYPAGDRTPGPAEPETDMLPSEPARRAVDLR